MTRIAYNRKPYQEAVFFLESNGYTLITKEDEYAGFGSPVYISDVNGYISYTTCSKFWSAIKRNNIPEKFNKDNPFALYNIEKWLKEFKGSISLKSTEYLGAREKLMFFCSVCSNEFDASWDTMYANKKGCPYCAGKRVSPNRSFASVHSELLQEWDYEKNSKSPEEYSPGSGRTVWWKCNSCGHSWKCDINVRVYNLGSGCPVCASTSRGENIVSRFLLRNNVEFETHKSILGCKSIRHLPFDFILGSGNFCIEYHGIQHYKPVDFGGKGFEHSINFFNDLKVRDSIKINFCLENNIRLLIIPYWEIKNIDKILMKEIFGG